MINEAGLPEGEPRQPILQHNILPNINLPVPNSRATPELQSVIRSIIQEVIHENTPRQEDLVDETINDRSNLSELDKIPDIVRCLRDFSGDPAEYTAWRKSVDRIFEIYNNIRGTAKYFGILSVVRNKIVGQANTSLEAYNTPLNWNAMKNCLNTHYADKRDIGTLEYQLTALVQGNNSVETFYEKVYSHFSLILNKISSNNYDRATSTVLIESYRNKALDTFIRGLNGDLPRLLSMKEPTDLPQALYLCNKLANQNYRSTYANNNQKSRINQLPPPPPPKRIVQSQFYPELTFYGRGNTNTIQRNNQNNNFRLPQNNNYNNQYYPPQNNNYTNQYYPQQTNYSPNNNNYPSQNFPILNNAYQNPPPRPFAPKPLPRPEPMEIDQSVRSQQINYANRPRIPYLGKGKLNNDTNYPPPKIQRNFHVTTTQDAFDMTSLEQDLSNQDNLQPLNEYLENYNLEDGESRSEHNYNDVSDVHFLEQKDPPYHTLRSRRGSDKF